MCVLSCNDKLRADKRANYDDRSVKVSRGDVSVRKVTEDPIAGRGEARKPGLAEEEIRAKRNRNVASKRSHQPEARLLNFDQVETADARRAAQK